MIYKITFKLESPISYIDLPTFDGVLAWCYMKDKYGMVEQPLHINHVEDFSDLPIAKHEEGYFIASWMQFDGDSNEFTGSWKKRWDNQHDKLTDFKGKKRKVRTNAGDFKPYDMPIVLHGIDKVWFYFISDNVDRVRVLVKNHLYGLGKKTSQGYGKIQSFEIEESDFAFDTVYRPIPCIKNDIQSGKPLSVKRMAWKPPYWLPQNMDFCLMP